MTEKRFTDVNISYEESWIRLKDNGLFLIFPIHYTDKEEYGLPTLEDLLNELNDENEQLKQTIKEVAKLLEEEVDLFSDKATEHDINAYIELRELDNKDAYYMATATKKAIKMLKGDV